MASQQNLLLCVASCSSTGGGRISLLHGKLKSRGSAVQGIEYIVTNQANRKEKLSLLKGVSGVLYPGLMSALVRLLPHSYVHMLQYKFSHSQGLSTSADGPFWQRQDDTAW